MKWRSLSMAVVAVAALAAVATPRVHAQEMDQCYDTRWGNMGCVRVEEFNFSDPVLALNSRYRLRGDVIYISTPEMQMTGTPQDSAAAQRGANRLTFRGEYDGQNARELYCIVYARAC
jgi:hypothetical protein